MGLIVGLPEVGEAWALCPPVSQAAVLSEVCRSPPKVLDAHPASPAHPGGEAPLLWAWTGFRACFSRQKPLLPVSPVLVPGWRRCATPLQAQQDLSLWAGPSLDAACERGSPLFLPSGGWLLWAQGGLGPGLLLVSPQWPCPGLVFLPSASHVWFSRSVQHQGRLSLDLSHRVGSDYSDMRASHGSNSLPSSARLGNGTTRNSHRSGALALFPSLPASSWPDFQVACPPGPFSASGADVGPTLLWEPSPSAFCVS